MKPIEIDGGIYSGYLIRTARTAGRCDYGLGIGCNPRGNGRCRNLIKPGDRYMQGQVNDVAGGYAQDRYCLECAATMKDDGVRAALASIAGVA